MKRKKRLTAALCLCTALFAFTAAFPSGAAAVESKKFTVGGSKYSIVSPSYTEEYINYLQNGSEDLLVPQMYKSTGTVLKRNGIALPVSYSSADLGYVTPVKDQGNLNTCWVFGAMSGLETYLLKNGLGDFDLSEEHANHWATTRANGTGWQRTYTDGGYSQMMPGYFTSWSGPRLESDIPYRSGDMLSFEEIDQKGVTTIGVTDLMFLENDPDSIKQAIYTYGSVTAGCSTLKKYFNEQKTAFYCPDDFPGSANTGGHVVSVIGWDDQYEKENFNPLYRPQEDGAWLVKNSWGAQSNVEGFYWISYEDKYIFNKRYGKNYAIVQADLIKENQKIYQNEIYGATYDMAVYENANTGEEYLDQLTYANVFDFSDDYRAIEQVIFESEAVGAAYTVYYIPCEDGAPVQDQTQWHPLANGYVPYSGYVSAETSAFIVPDGKGALGVQIDASGTDTHASLGVGEWLKNTTVNKMTFLPDVHKGDCYLFLDGAFLELTDVYQTLFNNDEIGGTLVIKAIASKSASLKGDVDGDGFINISDVLLMQKHLAKLLILDQAQIETTADLNGDCLLTIEDVLMLQNILAKKG